MSKTVNCNVDDLEVGQRCGFECSLSGRRAKQQYAVIANELTDGKDFRDRRLSCAATQGRRRDPAVFDDTARQALYQATKGILRKVNKLALTALRLVASRKESTVGESILLDATTDPTLRLSLFRLVDSLLSPF